VEDKTTTEKIQLISQLDEEEKTQSIASLMETCQKQVSNFL
jgi:hypothetical protein